MRAGALHVERSEEASAWRAEGAGVEPAAG